MRRVVVDTGVLISAFAFGGIPEKVVRWIFSREEMWVSPSLLEEYRSVPLELEKQKKVSHEQFKALLSGIGSFVVRAKVIVPKKKILICRDPADNILLECCKSARANILLSGDKDLLEISPLVLKKHIPNLKILTPRQFLNQTG